MDRVIEHINNVITEAARSHIASKEWFPVADDSNTTTLFEASLTFHHGNNSIIKSNDVSRPLMVGLAPVR